MKLRSKVFGMAVALGVAALSLGLALEPAAAAGTGYIFVSNERSNDISVLAPDTYALVKSIPTSRRPRDMHFNQDHTLLYVACGDDDVIDVIDVATLEVVDQIPTGPSPEMFEFNADFSMIYVSNEENSTAQVIDVEQKLIIHEIPTGAEPEGVMLSEDGRELYITSEIADMVHFVDVELGVVVDNVVVGTRPRRFALLQNELWVTDELSGQVSIIDRTTHQVTHTLEFLPPGFRPVDVTPVGIAWTKDQSTVLVTLGRANHIAFINTATKEIESYVLVGSRSWGVDLSPDESVAYVSNGLSDDLSIVDMATRRNVRTVPVGRIPHTVVVDDIGG
jgi:PQQ-dependent catabolism-associated beta-propeller protein